jgi:hypothetical protein
MRAERLLQTTLFRRLASRRHGNVEKSMRHLHFKPNELGQCRLLSQQWEGLPASRPGGSSRSNRWREDAYPQPRFHMKSALRHREQFVDAAGENPDIRLAEI